MKCLYNLLFVAVVLISVSPKLNAMRYDLSIEVDGEVRSFVISVPSGTMPLGGYPLVFMLHGTSGDGEKFYNISGWKEIGEEYGIITVFPSSLSWCVQDEEDPKPHKTTKWVCGDLLEKACQGQEFKDDRKFLSALADSVRSRFTVNPQMIFLSGFSNGGCMTSMFAVDAPGLFKAIAPTGASLSRLDSAIADTPTPTWHCVGTNDDRFYTAFGLKALPFNDSSFYYMSGSIHRFLGAYRLAEDFVKDSSDTMISWTYTTPLPGAPPAFYRFSLIKDLSHQYANGKNHPVSYAQMFWKFFTQVGKAMGVNDTKNNPTSFLYAYPNPSSNMVTIEAPHHESSTPLYLVNEFGTVVKELHVFGGKAVTDVSSIPAGIYVLLDGSYYCKLQVLR